MYYILEVKPSIEDKESFFELLWAYSENNGNILQGVFEGDAFSDIPFECDSDCAPTERDWVSDSQDQISQLYFNNRDDAFLVYEWILEKFPSLQISKPISKEEEDWNKKWKEGFSGVSLYPYFYIYPPWESPTQEQREKHNFTIALNPGSGFGTGTHETTQLCLEIIGKNNLSGNRFLDFGCGSGILSIALALQGGEGNAVDIDPLALSNAQENISLNLVDKNIDLSLSVKNESHYEGIVANILKHVLLDHSEFLVSKLKPEGWFLVSGLLEQDVLEVKTCYEKLLGRPCQFQASKNEWRALFWGKC